MVEFLALSILLLFGLAVTFLIDAFYKYKEGRASIHFIKCILGIFYFIPLMMLPFILQCFFDGSFLFTQADSVRLLWFIYIGGVMFITSYPTHKYMKYLNNKSIDELPEKDRKIYPVKMFIDRFSWVWMIGVIWMIVGVGLLIHELWTSLSK